MKTMKKLASLLLALVMMLALAVPGMAAGNYSITISGDAVVAEQEYAAYQIFKGEYSTEKETLSNIEWGSGIDESKLVDGKLGDKTAVEWAEYLSGKDNNSDEAKAFAALVGAALSGTIAATATAENGKVELTGLSDGYYLVKATKINEGNGESYTEYMLEVAGRDATATIKADKVTVDKVITGEDVLNGSNGRASTAAIGDDVPYEVTGTLPDNYGSYETYYYQFVDTFSTGLDYNKDVEVYVVNGETETKLTENTDYTVAFNETTRTLTVTFANLKNVTGVNADSKIVLKYTAKLNENAKVGNEGNDNTVQLIYSNDPNHSGAGDDGNPDPNNPKGETPKKETTTFVTELEVTKVTTTDEPGVYDYISDLAGATFTLQGEQLNIVLVAQEVFTEKENGEYYKLKDGTYTKDYPTEETIDAYASTDTKYEKTTVLTTKETNGTYEVVGTVSESGVVKFTGLMAGKYTLTETVTPDGYNTIDPITFEISYKYDGDNIDSAGDFEFILDPDKTPDGWAFKDGVLSVSIVNKTGSLLPETGGIGTTIFTVGGVVLMLGAAILLVTKKRSTID